MPGFFMVVFGEVSADEEMIILKLNIGAAEEPRVARLRDSGVLFVENRFRYYVPPFHFFTAKGAKIAKEESIGFASAWTGKLGP